MDILDKPSRQMFFFFYKLLVGVRPQFFKFRFVLNPASTLKVLLKVNPGLVLIAV